MSETSRQRHPAAAAAPPCPTRAQLNEAAIRHLGRYASSATNLVRVLERRVDRWRRAALEAGAEAQTVETEALQARGAAARVVAALVQAGALNDAALGSSRAANLTRSGKSKSAIARSLHAKGILPEDARHAINEAQPDAETELAAALVLARRKRVGPFGTAEAPLEAAARLKILAAFARAGFGRGVAERALRMKRDEAEARIIALKRGQAAR